MPPSNTDARTLRANGTNRSLPARALLSFLGLITLHLAVLPGALAQEQRYLAPPGHVGPPLALHATTNRAFQGIPSLAVAREGRLWATWYAGVTPNEDRNNYVVVSTSGDGGSTWREVLVIDPDAGGPVRAFDPELWLAPDGRLFVFWAQGVGDNDEARVSAALKGGVRALQHLVALKSGWRDFNRQSRRAGRALRRCSGCRRAGRRG